MVKNSVCSESDCQTIGAPIRKHVICLSVIASLAITSAALAGNLRVRSSCMGNGSPCDSDTDPSVKAAYGRCQGGGPQFSACISRAIDVEHACWQACERRAREAGKR